MKKTYNKPVIDVVELRGESLLEASEETQTHVMESKGNNFWSDEENEADEIAINDVWK